MQQRKIVMDLAPLVETAHHGMASLAMGLAKEALAVNGARFIFRFIASGKAIPDTLVADCVAQASSAALHAALIAKSLPDIDDDPSILRQRDVGLFLDAKQPGRVFWRDAQLHHDFAALSLAHAYPRDSVQKRVEGRVAQVATTDLFFATSEATARDLGWFYHIPRDRIIVTHPGHGIDLEAVSGFTTRLAGRRVEPYVLILATIEPRKNIALVLDWLRRHPERLEEFRFVFCGYDGWMIDFHELVDAFGLRAALERGRIVRRANEPDRVRTALLACAGATIQPSLYEGFGLAVLEAMALGVPVITSCTTSLPEIAGDTAYYFDPYTVDGLEAAFRDFVHDRERDTLAWRVEAGRLRARQFSFEAMLDQVTSAISALL